MKLERAREVGMQVIAALSSRCARATIAGSVRREKAEVKDVEIVYLSQEETRIVDLFGRTVTYPLTDRLIERLVEQGFWMKDKQVKRWGPLHKRLIFRETVIELFRAKRENWGLVLALRTGPADFNHILVTSDRWGGAMPGNMRMAGGFLLREGLQLETSDEASFFAYLGVPYWRPEERSAEKLNSFLQEGTQWVS